MLLHSVSVKNYRSITTKTTFTTGRQTILLGPNNEGKSNLLKAINLGFRILENWAENERIEGDGLVTGIEMMRMLAVKRKTPVRFDHRLYRRDRDFPLSLQDDKNAKATELHLVFKMDDNEKEDFWNEFKITINGDLPVRITLNKTSMKVTVVKQGPGSKTFNAVSHDIAKFIKERVDFVYVPAIRTGEQAVSMANRIVRAQFDSILENDQYMQLIKKLSDFYADEIDTLSDKLQSNISTYLPQLDLVSLKADPVVQLRNIDDMRIDDGTETSIDDKGDGVKSLVTMALVQELAKVDSKAKRQIIAIDEPEAHLHPRAIRSLKHVFEDVNSTSSQLLLATHNAIFVNRRNIRSNIIVSNNRARPAQGVEEVRDALGVESHDNLQAAELVIFVEGSTDKLVIGSLLEHNSESIVKWLEDGRLAIIDSGGASKVSTLVRAENLSFSRPLVILDADKSGRSEKEKIVENGDLNDGEIFLLGKSEGKVEGELEDILDPKIYIRELREVFKRPKLKDSYFKDKGNKWSENLERALGKAGIEWNSRVKNEAKTVVASCVKANPADALLDEHRDMIDNLVALIGEHFNVLEG